MDWVKVYRKKGLSELIDYCHSSLNSFNFFKIYSKYLRTCRSTLNCQLGFFLSNFMLTTKIFNSKEEIQMWVEFLRNFFLRVLKSLFVGENAVNRNLQWQFSGKSKYLQICAPRGNQSNNHSKRVQRIICFTNHKIQLVSKNILGTFRAFLSSLIHKTL